MNADHFIAARVSSETKSRLRALAERQQLSESALLKRLVEMTLRGAGDLEGEGLPLGSPTKASRRIYVRLRPEDHLLLRERAAARGMAGATYVSVLVRSHLRRLPPLPRDELEALKRTVAALGVIGRNLNQIARAANQGVGTVTPGTANVGALLKVCIVLREHVKTLIKANVNSWELGHADAPV
jgi:hypothetical protein